MAEAAALSAFLKMVIEKAASLLIHQSLRIWGADVRRDLDRLESNLSTVQAVLGDAEEKQVKDRALKQWLSKLKDAAYDADDILDDLDLEVLRREAAGNNKVRRFFSSGCPLLFSVRMGQRVREVVERFNEIAEERSKFLLSPADYSSSSRITADIDRRETHSFVVESGVIGRREDVSRIVEILINLNNGKLKSARVLALRGANFMNVCLFSFPKDSLKHLRYLDLSDTNIKTLPVSINCLFHLQTLKLRRCRELRELPSGIGDIRSLRHLYTDGCDRLSCMPRGMGKLSSLQTLSMYVLGRKAGSGSIIELKELDIGGKLELCELRNVRSAVDAREVRLSSKQNI